MANLPTKSCMEDPPSPPTTSQKKQMAKDALYTAVRNADADAIDAALIVAAQLQLQNSHAYQMAKTAAPGFRLVQEEWQPCPKCNRGEASWFHGMFCLP